VAVVVF